MKRRFHMEMAIGLMLLCALIVGIATTAYLGVYYFAVVSMVFVFFSFFTDWMSATEEAK